MKNISSRACLVLLCLSTVLPWTAHAQGNVSATADYIVALANSEPITNSELRAAIRRVTEQIRNQGQTAPPEDELRKNVLERLINDRVQLQVARENGLRVEDAAVDLAEQNLARQYQVSVDDLHTRLAKDGLTPEALRTELRDQILLGRLREHEVDSQVKISDQDVDRYIAQQQNSNIDPMAQEINLAQLLIAVPEHADGATVASLQSQAQKLLQRARAGEDFSALVKQYSGADKENGGLMGLRRADRYPPLFVTAVQSLPVGGVSDLVRSGAGFHILKVMERNIPSKLVRTVEERHARHILLRLSPDLTQVQALARLSEYRQRILAGKDSFESLARQYSQDGSAPRGGDLGWAKPGIFVPEFEDVLEHLKVDEVSLPMMSRFGAHLIQLLEVRTVELSQRDVREQVRQQLHDAKLDESYSKWAKDIRERAFVEYRTAPQ